MESTSGQISLQLPSFCASLKTKNKTDPELTFEITITDDITYLCTQWIMLTVSYICILFSDRTWSFFFQYAGLFYIERWWQEVLKAVKM